MERVLEPEVMDHPDDAEEYEAMDFHEPDGRFAEVAHGFVAGLRAPRIVDLGTGTASIPILLLDRHPSASVVAVWLHDCPCGYGVLSHHDRQPHHGCHVPNTYSSRFGGVNVVSLALRYQFTGAPPSPPPA